MKSLIGCAAIILALAMSQADAKGCLKGAVVGGAAGHYAGHHGLLGAAACCMIGHNEAKKRARMQQDQANRPDRDIHEDGNRI
jgi:hypothetical protein